ncbi:PepSY domain-containing protein [Staphylococcus chromogenes]|uniref:PepSY domain-containing protein n=1 Tax=Staphylococcus chromogenes TaxID=46126 RepID=UPI0034DB35D1
MKPFIKIIIIVISLILTLLLGMMIYANAHQSYMSKENAQKLVEKRYEGKVKEIHPRNGDSEFEVKLVSADAEYHIVIDRKKEAVKKITKIKSSPSKKTKQDKVKQSKINEKQAKAIAKKHVGGTFVAIKRHQSKQTEHYAVTQHVNTAEGANVVVNRMTGKVTSVSWFTRGDAPPQEEATVSSPQNNPTAVAPSNEMAPPQNTLQPPSTPTQDDDDDDDWDDD